MELQPTQPKTSHVLTHHLFSSQPRMEVAPSNQLHYQTVVHIWHRTHTHNSPATSKISCHTSQLCTQEVGITNHPPLRIKLVIKTTKKCISTKHKQHTNNTQARKEFTTQQTSKHSPQPTHRKNLPEGTISYNRFSNRRKRYDIPTSRNHVIQGLTSKYNLNLWRDLWQSEATFNHTLKYLLYSE